MDHDIIRACQFYDILDVNLQNNPRLSNVGSRLWHLLFYVLKLKDEGDDMTFEIITQRVKSFFSTEKNKINYYEDLIAMNYL
jgi:hypothetical protein